MFRPKIDFVKIVVSLFRDLIAAKDHNNIELIREVAKTAIILARVLLEELSTHEDEQKSKKNENSEIQNG